MVKKVTNWQFLEPLLYAEEFLHLADVSRQLKCPHVTARMHLNEFEKAGVVVKKQKGKLTLYRLNFSNPLLIDYIILAEKEKLIRTCRKDLLLQEAIFLLHKHFEKNKVLVFGSAVEDASKANDIDLLVVGELKAKDELKKFEATWGVKFHIIDVKDLEDIHEALKHEIASKHLIVEGVEELVRWLLKS